MVPPCSPSRRGALLALAGGGLLAVGGCDLDARLRTPGTQDGPGRDGAVDPDRRLVDRVAAESAELERLLAATVAAQPALGPVLDPLRGMHSDHLRVLGGAAPSGSATPTAPASPAPTGGAGRALRRVRSRESAHVRSLALAAGEAGSGALARVLASMAAGAAQHAATLPRPEAS